MNSLLLIWIIFFTFSLIDYFLSGGFNYPICNKLLEIILSLAFVLFYSLWDLIWKIELAKREPHPHVMEKFFKNYCLTTPKKKF